MQIEPTRTPERWFSVAQALLAQPSIDSVVRLPYSIELAYLKGLRAVQKADVKSALLDYSSEPLQNSSTVELDGPFTATS